MKRQSEMFVDHLDMPTRPLRPSDYADAGAVFRRSMEDDPPLHILFTRAQYAAHSAAWFSWMCWVQHASAGMSEVATDKRGRILSVALWEPAEMTLGMGLRAALFMLWMLVRLGPSFVRAMLSVMNESDTRRHRHAPGALHLTAIGTDPDAQGRGVGSVLIRIGIKRADAAGRSCYLESSNPRNLTFYRRHGFRTVEEWYPWKDDARVEGTGPVITLMKRDAVGGKKAR
jgi:ribosomal protein S18 acetylase RimI-like enzyme